MFLAQALKPDRSCQNIVNDAAVKRLTHGLPQCSTKTTIVTIGDRPRFIAFVIKNRLICTSPFVKNSDPLLS
jgi:hypothetical protein